MLDMSTAMTTNGMVKRLYNEKGQFAHEWLIDADGTPSHDPAIRFAKTPGAIMRLGGFSAGYKGTGLGMTVEALTHGLSGNGRHSRQQGGKGRRPFASGCWRSSTGPESRASR